jgi:hypothetical protein
MTLYLAVTPDELELPLYVTDSVQAMAEWAGVKVKTVYEQCSRNKDRLPYKRALGGSESKHRLRKIKIEGETE